MSLDSKALVAILRKAPVLSGCALISGILIMVIYFRLDMISSTQKDLDQRSAEGKKYHDNLVNAGQLNEQLAVITAANRIVRERAMHPADLAKNLQYFYRLESEAGVKYTDLKPGGVATVSKAGSKTYIPVNYPIAVQGEFSNIIDFLRHLEQGFYFYRLNNMVATTTGAGHNVTLTLNIDFIGQL